MNLIKLVFIYLQLPFILSGNKCSLNQKYCSSAQTCIDKNITCIDRCNLCIKRQKGGENIACINDCDHDTTHLVGLCVDYNCEDTKVCPDNYIVQKIKCECSCIPENIVCDYNYLCPKITELSIPNDNINGYTVYEISIILKPETYNIYAIYGDSKNNLIIPSAYQVHQHIGMNLGGINPVILNYIHDSIFDSWFTIAITDGNDMGYINSIGINWNDWSQDSGLIIDNGAIFINDPLLKLSNTNEYVIAHLTVSDLHNHQLNVNINGKLKPIDNLTPTETNSYQELNIIFNIPKKEYPVNT